MPAIKKTICAVLLLGVTQSYALRGSTEVVNGRKLVSSAERELQGPFFFAEQEQQLKQQDHTQEDHKTEPKPQVQTEQQPEKDQEHESTLATLKDEARESLTFQGPTIMFGLELNTTKSGNIDRNALSNIISEELNRYLSDELSSDYQLKEIVIDNVQSLTLELIRKRKLEAQELKTHEFVLTANTEFLTSEIPSENELKDLVMAIQLPASVFDSSYSSILSSTTGVKLFAVRTSASALMVSEDVPAGLFAFMENMEHSTLIFMGAGVVLFVALATISFYSKANAKEVEVKDVVPPSCSLVVAESNEDPEFPGDKSIAGNGVLFVASESASCSDDSLAEERGLNNETFSVVSYARKVVNDVAEDTFSCGFEVPSPPQRKTRVWDIDSVLCDSDSECEGRRRKQDYRLKAKVVSEVIDNGMSCGIPLPIKHNRPLDIDAIVASDSESEEGRKCRSGKKRHLPGDDNIELVPRTRMYHKAQRQRYERPRNDDIFTVVSDEDEGEGCVMVNPRTFVENVVDEAIEEGFDCGMSLAGY